LDVSEGTERTNRKNGLNLKGIRTSVRTGNIRKKDVAKLNEAKRSSRIIRLVRNFLRAGGYFLFVLKLRILLIQFLFLTFVR
jgi:hypothetical protein